MSISGGSNIEILGGMYAGNNLGSEPHGVPADQPYGIYATNVTGLRIVGTSCVGEYEQIIQSSRNPSPRQAIGIYIDNGASGVIISACDARNNSAQGIYVNGGAADVVIEACDVRGNLMNGILVNASTTAVTDVFIRDCNARGTWAYNTAIAISGSGSNISTVQVTNCAGYNDQGVSSTYNATGGTTSFYPYTFGYSGPVEFFVSPGAGETITSIRIDGLMTPLTSGSFLLGPGESATVTWTPPSASLSIPAVGK